VRSQRELLEASTPNPATRSALPDLDVDANELTLVYRARGMSAAEAQSHADEVLNGLSAYSTEPDAAADVVDEHEAVGNGWSAAISSFCFFASGALIPIIPYLFGLQGTTAVIVASVLVGIVLLGTGAIVGLLSGGSPLKRALRQLGIGFGAAAATYLLGLLFGATLG
jgi:VIT1/CCC1 family predicted Fe2+/Mn2+ transporter